MQTNISTTSDPDYEYRCGGEEPDGLRFYTVLVLKISDGEGVKMRDMAAFERSVRESFTPNKKIVKSIPIEIQGGIGLEVFITNTRNDMDNMRGRVIILRNNRHEVGFVASNRAALESAEAEQFFASFKPQ